MEFLAKVATGRLGLGALSVATVFVLYIIVTNQPDNNPALLPPLTDIFNSFVTNVTSGSLFTALGQASSESSWAFSSARRWRSSSDA